ncbi:hypothetical protein [Aquabacter sediminis]|uniref:hypothetical protein n=1 Tax=Aquabacter sediminis TaxID=3029197 RepID=UPI00237E9488|nr:hypothetical protein [Aquabacter sp. P-9]MDE1567714.1 hypothetical protein [Aquabacter sp. P-9]
MSGGSPGREPGDAVDFATYVASLAGELSKVARGHRLTTLCYLLEMVLLEARGVLRKAESGRE